MFLRIFISILSLIFISRCNNYKEKSVTAEDLWRLRWRMQASIEFDKDIKLAKKQFDILQQKTNDIEVLKIGIAMLDDEELEDKIISIVCKQPDSIKSELCFYRKYPIKIECCSSVKKKVILKNKESNPELRDTLLIMFLKDQAHRGFYNTALANKYNLKIPEINSNGYVDVDGENVRKLNTIIEKYGLPNISMVGKDALFGIWMIIHHANNPWWQESMLPYVEGLVQKEELNKSELAYLKDRIATNLSRKQIYGTQVKEFDKAKNIFVLKPIEDSINVDKRRMQVGLPPIEYYKRSYFK